MRNKVRNNIRGDMVAIDIKVKLATLDVLFSWMELIRLVSWNFPGLETEESLLSYQETVIKNINRNTAICATYHEKVVGVLLFSVKHSMLSCMAVHPNYRRYGIATKMINLMLTHLPNNCDIVVTTFREDDEKGIAPRTLYKQIGFTEGELCYEFNYPQQRFILPGNKRNA
jgi:ribosomal protein S18 acetylase RimI-like enzyme